MVCEQSRNAVKDSDGVDETHPELRQDVQKFVVDPRLCCGLDSDLVDILQSVVESRIGWREWRARMRVDGAESHVCC